MAHSKIRAALFACALALSAAGAHAAPVTYNFTGEVGAIDVFKVDRFGGVWTFDVANAELAGHRFVTGSKLTGTLTYDAANATFLNDFDPSNPGNNLHYELGTFKLEYTIATASGYHYTNTGPGYATTDNDQPGDFMGFETYTVTNEQNLNLRNDGTLVFNDATGVLLNSGMPPAEINTLIPSLLAHSALRGGLLDFGGSGTVSFRASITSMERVNVSAVPEPSAYLMLLAGLGAIGLASRRQRPSPKL